MLLAHGPLGALIAWKTLQSSRNFSTLRKKQWLFLFAGFLGGLFPDIDLFYTYLIDATLGHREFYTHSLPVYIVAFLVLYAMCALTRRPSWVRMLVIVFFLGIMSHLASDALGGQVSFFLPFTTRLFGLTNIVPISHFGFLLNWLFEVVVLFCFGTLLTYLLIRNRVVRVLLVISFVVFWIFGSIGVVFVYQHTLHPDGNFAYVDTDEDGARNRYDEDLDGDGVVNSRDTDSDNDGLSNIEEFMIAAEKVWNIWADPANGKWLEIPARLGFVSAVDLVTYVYYEAGVPLFPEMKADYFVSEVGYVSSPSNAYFDSSVENLEAWLAHSQRLLAFEKNDMKIGDILFFGNGSKAHLAVVKTVSSETDIVLIESHPSHGVSPISYNLVRQREGEPTGIGRLLYPVMSD